MFEGRFIYVTAQNVYAIEYNELFLVPYFQLANTTFSVRNSLVWRTAEEKEAWSPLPCAYQSLKCQLEDSQSVSVDKVM